MPENNPPIFGPENFDPDDPNLPDDLENPDPSEEPVNPGLMPTQSKQERRISPWVWIVSALIVAAAVLTVVIVRSGSSDQVANRTAAAATDTEPDQATETATKADEAEAAPTNEAEPAAEKGEVNVAAMYNDVIRPAYKELRDEQKRLASEVESLKATHDRTVTEFELIVIALIFAIVISNLVLWYRLKRRLEQPAEEGAEEP